jgi:hypothetical protein
MEPELESILIANWYFVRCKFDCSKSEESKKIARNYLTGKIGKIMAQRTSRLSQNFIKKDHQSLDHQ